MPLAFRLGRGQYQDGRRDKRQNLRLRRNREGTYLEQRRAVKVAAGGVVVPPDYVYPHAAEAMRTTYCSWARTRAGFTKILLARFKIPAPLDPDLSPLGPPPPNAWQRHQWHEGARPLQGS